MATVAHGAGYLAVTALVAWVVFEWLGVGLLRKAWVNLDLIWAFALIVSGGLTLAI
jgi:predicted neutral ceramidase superfamily lipid hydrolase